MDKLASKFETIFSMVSCLSSNTMSVVGWYVDSEASRHMAFNKKAFGDFRSRRQAYKWSLVMMPRIMSHTIQVLSSSSATIRFSSVINYFVQ